MINFYQKYYSLTVKTSFDTLDFSKTTVTILNKTRLDLNIRHLRKENNFSQTQLGSMLGIGASMVSAYEKGRHLPSLEVLFTLTEIFKVTLDTLVYHDFSATIKNPDIAEEPISVYTESGEGEKEDLPASSLLRLVMRLETELHDLKERIKKEAPELAKEWGIK